MIAPLIVEILQKDHQKPFRLTIIGVHEISTKSAHDFMHLEQFGVPDNVPGPIRVPFTWDITLGLNHP